MTLSEAFGEAKWLSAGEYASPFYSKPQTNGTPNFPLLRAHFTTHAPKRAVLRVIGLGFFHAYLNGRDVTDDRFLPLSTDYEARERHPLDEVLFGHRIYVPEYDVTNLLTEGENLLCVHFGGGWYTFGGGWLADGETERWDEKALWFEKYGDPKVIYRLEIEDADGHRFVCSSEADKIGDSFVKTYMLTNFETQDYRDFDESEFTADFDDAAWSRAKLAKPLETEYLFTDCPADRAVERIVPKLLFEKDGVRLYDNGENLTGYPVLKLFGKCGDRVTLAFGESLKEDGTLDPTYCYKQSFSVVCDGKEREASAKFTWFGFRYFTVAGCAEPVAVEKIHTDAKLASTFETDNDLLNWLYETYLRTQYCNMHAGIPSDCPTIERRGYTGDGELCAPAAMTMLDAKAFYAKWLGDISDCQDTISGHVQYTAPYTRCGGGPGAWGGAMVEMPYFYWKQYGDASFAEKMYPQMKRYFDYLEAHSEFGLVTSDKKGEWCLGDWLPPDDVAIPAPFVNNYYYIRTLMHAKVVAKHLGKEEDAKEFDERIALRKRALVAAYFGTWDGNFFGNVQGGNAFACDLGIDRELGDKRTYSYLLKHYRNLGRFDTGICGTEILTRLLFERGDGELAMDLLLSEDRISFCESRKLGYTTLGESWPHSFHDRSHDHPMFGGCFVNFFDHLLGIRQSEESFGYDDLLIAPTFTRHANRISGSRRIPQGEVKVSYVREQDGIHAEITLPEGKTAAFTYGEKSFVLNPGKNVFTIEEKV